MSKTQEFLEAVSMGEEGRARELLAADPSLAQARTEAGVSAVLLGFYYQEPGIARFIAARKGALDVFEAAVLGDTGRLEELLDEAPGLATAFTSDGYQALHLAAFFDQPEAARMLLARGAPAGETARNGSGIQPLHAASAAGQTVVCQMLLDAGADPNARQAGGFAPLHAAGQNGDATLARLLLERGAERGQRTEDGKTAHDFALEKGHAELAEMLIPGSG